MIDYEQFEIDICDVLCPVTVDAQNVVHQLNTIYQAKPLPDNNSEFSKTFTKPIVYVVCTNSDYDSPSNLDVIIQEETITFEILLRANTRKGTAGIFAIINDIKSKLLGYRISRGYTKFRLIKNGYIDSTTQNDWNYMISFSTTTKIAEDIPEPTYPTFQNIEITK
jgi:hypothetical protein